MAPKHGKRLARTRTFSTGFSVVRFCLDKSYPTPIVADKQIGALYIPTKWGGILKLHGISLESGKNVAVRLFYKNGTIGNAPTMDELNAGTFALCDWNKAIIHEIPIGKMGWFFIAAEGENKVKIGNIFIQEHSTAFYKITNEALSVLTNLKVPNSIIDKLKTKLNEVSQGDIALKQKLISLLGTADTQKYLAMIKKVLHHRPWNSWYWPAALAKPPHLYDAKGVKRVGKIKNGAPYRPPAPLEDGPLAKYDLFKNLVGPNSSAEYEWEDMGKDVPADSVGGHCDAIARAGFEEERPIGAKTVTNSYGNAIILTEYNRLGLLTERYWSGWDANENHDTPTSQELFSMRNGFLRADWFHDKLRTRIAENKGGIQIHDERNWNYLIFKFRSQYKGFGTSDSEVNKIKIVTDMAYVHWGTSPSDERQKWYGGPQRTITTKYEIEFNPDGTVKREITPWKKECIQNNVSKPISAVWYFNKTAELLNPKLEKTILESLYP